MGAVKSKVISLRMSEDLLELVALRSRDQRADRATTLRQWLYAGAEEYALILVSEGRLSASRAAEMLELSIYDIYEMAKARGLELGATAEQYRASAETWERLQAVAGRRAKA